MLHERDGRMEVILGRRMRECHYDRLHYLAK